jgi:hypothetical protein
VAEVSYAVLYLVELDEGRFERLDGRLILNDPRVLAGLAADLDMLRARL